MKRYDVYGLGQAILDTEYEVNDALLNRFHIPKGQMTRLDEASHRALIHELEGLCQPTYCSCGGSVANSVVTLQSMGGNAYYSGTVAKDLAGQNFLKALSQCGITHNSNASLEDNVTGQCVVMVTPDSERSMNTFLGAAAAVSNEHIDYDALDQSQVFFIEGYAATCDNTVEAILAAKAHHQAKGGEVALTFCDPFMVESHKEALDTIIGDGVDLLFCNEQEASLWSDSGVFSEGTKALLQRTKILVVTRGSKGAWILTQSGCIKIPAEAVTATNTNGAGDNFAGAFLYAYTQGFDLEHAGCIAGHTAATVVTQDGPRLAPAQYQYISDRFSSKPTAIAL